MKKPSKKTLVLLLKRILELNDIELMKCALESLIDNLEDEN